MPNGIVDVPVPINEPVLGYAPQSPERAKLAEHAVDDVATDDRDHTGHRRSPVRTETPRSR
jgi:hypothetical protein